MSGPPLRRVPIPLRARRMDAPGSVGCTRMPGRVPAREKPFDIRARTDALWFVTRRNLRTLCGPGAGSTVHHALIAQLDKLESGTPRRNPRERTASIPGHASKGSAGKARGKGDREEPQAWNLGGAGSNPVECTRGCERGPAVRPAHRAVRRGLGGTSRARVARSPAGRGSWTASEAHRSSFASFVRSANGWASSNVHPEGT